MTHHDWCPFGTGERAGPCFGCECVEAAVAEAREAGAAPAAGGPAVTEHERARRRLWLSLLVSAAVSALTSLALNLWVLR